MTFSQIANWLQMILFIITAFNALYAFVAAIRHHLGHDKHKSWFLWNDGLAMFIFMLSLSSLLLITLIKTVLC